MVKMRAGMVEDEEATSARAKLSASLDEHIPDPDERKYVEPRLAHLLGLEESGARDRESLFSAWRILFERMAERAPTLLIFEDVQWADAGMLDFIEYLLDWSRSHALLLVTLARPELSDKRPEWGAGRRSVTSPVPRASCASRHGGIAVGSGTRLTHRYARTYFGAS